MTPASAMHANTLSIMAVASQLTSSVAVYSAVIVRLTAVAIKHLNTSVLLLQHKHAAATAWFLRWHQRESYRVLEVTGLSSRRSNGRHSCRGRLRQPHKLLGPALHRKVPVAVVALVDEGAEQPVPHNQQAAVVLVHSAVMVNAVVTVGGHGDNDAVR